MRSFFSACLTASMFVMLPAGGAFAAIETVPDVVSSCPIEARVDTCSHAVLDFLTAIPQEQLDLGIAEVVAALAEAAKNPSIAALADGLCEGKRLPDRTVTGSVNGLNGNGGDGPPQSIIDPIPSGPTPQTTDPTPPGPVRSWWSWIASSVDEVPTPFGRRFIRRLISRLPQPT